MALKRNETYPGRFSNPTDDHPQGAFKNRSAPGAQDGSYLEQQWVNDWDGFFGRLLTIAGVTPNGSVDTASSSQYYDALKSLFLQRTDPFGDIKSDGAVHKALENLGLGDGSALPVGVPVPWPSATPPTGWIKCNGAPFSAVEYPELAKAYPTNELPDLRGEFIRGWDDGRGIDTGRELLSAQGDAIRNITGWFGAHATVVAKPPFVKFSAPETSENIGIGGEYTKNAVKLDLSLSVPTASENRPRSIAFNYIVRAA